MTEEQTVESLRAVEREGRWSLVGSGPGGVDVVNDYLGYLADRGYSPRTVRAYAFDLLAFARWLVDEGLGGRRGHHGGAAAVLGVLPVGVDCRAGRAATCTRSATAATSAMRRRRSTAGSPRSRGCSPSGRCGTGRGQPGAARRRPAGAAAGEQSGLLAHLRQPEAALAAAGAGAAAAAARSGPQGDRPRCWAASAPTGTGRSRG